MTLGKYFWSDALRLAINLVPWLIVLQVVCDVATAVWLKEPLGTSWPTKLVVFALVGILVTWKLPLRNMGPHLGTNILWLSKLIVGFSLWIAVVDRVWTIVSAPWTSHPLEWSFVAYTAILGLVAFLLSRKWIPTELFRM